VLFDQAGLGRGKVGDRGIEKRAVVCGLEHGTSFGEARPPYLQTTQAAKTFAWQLEAVLEQHLLNHG
jgi:hypothetical protein